MSELRVLSYNVRSLRDDPEALGRVIRSAQPHVVLVQEAPRFWRWFHWTFTGGMVVGFLWILISSFPHHNFGPRVDVLIGEVMCAWSFGPSWLAKGFERDTLSGMPIAERRRDSTQQGTPPEQLCSDDG